MLGLIRYDEVFQVKSKRDIFLICLIIFLCNYYISFLKNSVLFKYDTSIVFHELFMTIFPHLN